MIEINGLTKKFKKIIAVDNVSLSINDGEIFGLLGPNGAGKSTLINLLATIIKPDSGSAKVGGFSIIDQPYNVRKLISVSFQDPKLDWQLNLVETLRFHGKVYKIPKVELNKRINELIKSLKLEDYRKIKNWKLSGGTRKKIEVCKVLVAKPKIAIFDEPTAFLDPVMKKIIWDYIKELNDENGSTIILATNLMHEADVLSDRVAIMNEGKIIKIDSPENLKNSIPAGNIIMINFEKNTCKLELKEVKSQLLNLPYISEIYFKENSENTNEIEMKILVRNIKKVTPEILQFFQSNKIIIKNLETTNPSLDDVFFYYTKSLLTNGG